LERVSIYQLLRENPGEKAGYHNVVGRRGFGKQVAEMYFPKVALKAKKICVNVLGQDNRCPNIKNY
jgi:hypothetical protein